MLGLRWCRAIHKQWLAGGFSHVAVFLFEIDNAQSPQDKELWVVVGDLPPAYLVIDRSPNFKDALLAYIYEMRRWVKAVKGGRSTARCIPVNVKPTMEHAAMLQSRLDFIEKKYVPSLARENRT